MPTRWYYSQLMVVAYGGSAKDAALNGQVIKARRLEEIAAKPVLSRVEGPVKR